MISLILPKLILSAAIARDGMFTFSKWPVCADQLIFYSTTQGKSAGISSELAKLQITRGDFDVFFPANLKKFSLVEHRSAVFGSPTCEPCPFGQNGAVPQNGTTPNR